jgi:hypothetical protein
MRRIFLSTLVMAALMALGAAPSQAAIQGTYVEARSADVWTGPCFANSQVNLQGKQAILGWKVNRGTWNGTSLSGLGVVAVVRAKATLGDIYDSPYPAEAVLIVDQRANASQRRALVSLAKAQAGRLLNHIVRVDAAPITFEETAHNSVTLRAGDLAVIHTRALCAGDIICGNEETYYPPLTNAADATPAYTLEDSFKGAGLGEVWTHEDRRSAFVGTFSL